MGVDLSSFLWPDAEQGRQPWGPAELNYDHPLAKYAIDVVTPFSSLIPYGVPQRLVGARGLALKGNGSNTYFYRNSVPKFDINNFTMLAVIEGSAGIDNRLYSYGESSNEQTLLCIGAGRIWNPFTPMRIFIRDPSGYACEAQNIETADPVFEDNIPHVAVLSSGYTPERGGNAVTGYVDGKYQVFAAVATALVQPTSLNRLCIGGLLRSGFGSANPARLYLGILFNTRLSNDEVASISANPWQIFQPQSLIFTGQGASVTLPTLGRPVSDTSPGLWLPSTGATLAGCIDEATPDDADYIHVNAASTCELLLNETAYPLGAAQALNYRASSQAGATLTVALKQGVTVIATWTHGLTPIDTLYSQSLTPEQAALITSGALSISLTSS